MFKVKDCQLINLSGDNYIGSTSLLLNSSEVPFVVKRFFYIYNVPVNEYRGAHAHIECYQFIIVISGSFEIEINDGIDSKKIVLNNVNSGLLIPPGIWAVEKNLTKDSLMLVLASDLYDESDYIRNIESYLKYRDDK